MARVGGGQSWGPWMLAWSESPWLSEAGAGLCPPLVSLPSVLSPFHKKTQWPSVWTRPWGPRGDSGTSAGACLECPHAPRGPGIPRKQELSGG